MRPWLRGFLVETSSGQAGAGSSFKPFGIKGWRVLKAVGTPFGGKPAYSVICNLEFDTADQFRSAVAAEGGPVFGDVPNFSNKDPVVVIGDLVEASK